LQFVVTDSNSVQVDVPHGNLAGYFQTVQHVVVESADRQSVTVMFESQSTGAEMPGRAVDWKFQQKQTTEFGDVLQDTENFEDVLPDTDTRTYRLYLRSLIDICVNWMEQLLAVAGHCLIECFQNVYDYCVVDLFLI
jgi:hypothetical protein